MAAGPEEGVSGGTGHCESLRLVGSLSESGNRKEASTEWKEERDSSRMCPKGRGRS